MCNFTCLRPKHNPNNNLNRQTPQFCRTNNRLYAPPQLLRRPHPVAPPPPNSPQKPPKIPQNNKENKSYMFMHTNLKENPNKFCQSSTQLQSTSDWISWITI